MTIPLLRRLYAPEFMVRPSLIRGEIPNTKEAYSATLNIAWASIAETFLIALMSMMDTMMVGVVGHHAIAAVGLVTQPRFIVLAVIVSLNAAVTTITARRKGENDPEGALNCLKQSLLLCVGFSVVLSYVAYLGRTPLLLFTGAQDDTLELAREYFEIILLGTPINAISMTISAAQRGVGSTRTSMIINMAANLVNLVLNFLLIGGRMGFPALGVRGAAIATVIGWGVGLVFALISVLHKHGYFYIIGRDGWLPDKVTLRALYIVSSGTFLEQICMRVGFLANTMVVAGLGTIVFATHNICTNIMSLSFSFGEGFGIAASALVGQNMGAKRPDLSIMYGNVCQRLSFITSSVMLFVFVFQGETLIRLFTNEPEIVSTSRLILVIVAIVVIGQAGQMIFMGSLRGAGDTRYTAVVSLISIVLVRPVVGYLLAYPLGVGLLGIWLAFIVDQAIRLTLTARRFASGKWMNIEL